MNKSVFFTYFSNRSMLKTFGCVFSLCCITACAPPKSTIELPIENQQSPSKQPLLITTKTKKEASTISSWNISGAMAAHNKNKGWSASLQWIQEGENQYQIRLFGPLGGGTVLIEKNKGMVTYTDGTKKVASHSADELLQQQTGIRLPVHNLYYWTRGLPAPGAVQSSTYDQNHHLQSLSQGGYTIVYTN